MNFFEAIVLGAVQGLTEFLPVSSSGHLVIFQHFFGLKEPHLSFDIAVHVGTLAAVFIYFWKDIRSLFSTIGLCLMLLLKKQWADLPTSKNNDIKLMLLILIGSIPTVVIGLLFYKISDQIFSSVFLVGVMLLITGALLALTRMIRKKGVGINGFSAEECRRHRPGPRDGHSPRHIKIRVNHCRRPFFGSIKRNRR